MKSGYKTSEFLVHLGVILATWTTTALAMMGQLHDFIPHKYDQDVLLATMVLTALQSAAYSLSRSKVKVQALKTQEAEAALELRRLSHKA